MKLYINKPLTDLSNKPIYMGPQNVPQEQKEQAKLGSVCVEALMAETEQNEPGGKKLHRWQLAKGIVNKMKEDTTEMAFIETSVEDLDLIKTRIGKAYGATIVGPAFTAIEV